jgi:hypothetical protein
MSILIIMEWDGVTIEDYEAVRKQVDWEGTPPAGGIVHVAARSDEGLRVVDVWESAEQFQRFVESRLMPGAKQLGIDGDPRVHVLPVHALFAPGLPVE